MESSRTLQHNQKDEGIKIAGTRYHPVLKKSITDAERAEMRAEIAMMRKLLMPYFGFDASFFGEPETPSKVKHMLNEVAPVVMVGESSQFSKRVYREMHPHGSLTTDFHSLPKPLLNGAGGVLLLASVFLMGIVVTLPVGLMILVTSAFIIFPKDSNVCFIFVFILHLSKAQRGGWGFLVRQRVQPHLRSFSFCSTGEKSVPQSSVLCTDAKGR